MIRIIEYVKCGVALLVSAASAVIREFFTRMGHERDIDDTIKLFKKRLHGTVAKRGVAHAATTAVNKVKSLFFRPRKKSRRPFPNLNLQINWGEVVKSITKGASEGVFSLTEDMILAR